MIMKGQKISDRYQILKSIGEGGMANVYLAYDTILDRNVAVKVLRGDLAGDEKFVRRFQREALSASSLSHPNIVEVYDVGDDDGLYYIVMEYVEGQDLKSLIKKRGKLTVTEAVDIMKQISDGMSVAHDSYIIHRDIKPQNIMILDNGLVKIMDFGIAMAINSTQLTQTNSVMGSVHYLPPEQANGKGSTLQSDIYSMGIVMYELLTGKLPYKGDNAVEIALKHLKEPIPSVRETDSSIPQAVENIVIKATSKNTKNRYEDAREMYEDLSTCLDDERKNEEKIELPYPDTLDGEPVKKPTKDKKKKEKEKDPFEEFDEEFKEDKKPKKTTKKEEKKKEDIEDQNEVIAKEISEGDMKKNGGNKILIGLTIILTLLVVAITTVMVLIPNITKSESLVVPDVTGYTVEDAIKTLQDAGFVIADEQLKVASEEIGAGKIVKTSPLAGVKRTKGTSVTLTVSTGDQKITIEDYTGKNVNEVKGMLEARGLHVLIEAKDTDKENPSEYEIIDQSTKSGEKLASGDYITLYTPNLNKYPDFTTGTYTYESVVSYLEDYGVTVIKEEKEDNTHSPGTVIAQTRSKGSPIVSGTSIVITVSKKPTVEENKTEEDSSGTSTNTNTNTGTSSQDNTLN